MKKALLFTLVVLACASAVAIDFRVPQLLAHMKEPQPYNIDFQEKQVILRNKNYVWINSIFNPWSPRLEAVFFSQYIIEDVNMLSNNHLYICSQEPGNLVSTVDTLSYPSSIYFPNIAIGNKMTREGSMLYVADRFRGIDIIDIGKGASRELRSTFSEKWGIRDFIAEYPYLWALNDFGLVTVDITDLNFPLSMGVNYEITDATVMAKNGDIVWLGAGKMLLAINAADMYHPRLIFQTRLSNDIRDMELKDNLLYLALGMGGVKILDVTNPLKVEDLRTIIPYHEVFDIALDGDLIFLALGKDGWMIYEYR
ncbi:MAG: hypothetical protein WCY21_02225 [Candidatus Cloacimonadaceae bacterium]|jgi:hypothetical protein|nr:hypothetical protein [Candidatus Cloacimonadota bacterium]MDX9949193.1 hypothetical protein [Candidatus Syntrophosphaera sp.]NLN85294.1 hypothetical protein [Candidatus Cloacimonadota bacterium]